jgi:hypothetical protein
MGELWLRFLTSHNADPVSERQGSSSRFQEAEPQEPPERTESNVMDHCAVRDKSAMMHGWHRHDVVRPATLRTPLSPGETVTRQQNPGSII